MHAEGQQGRGDRRSDPRRFPIQEQDTGAAHLDLHRAGAAPVERVAVEADLNKKVKHKCPKQGLADNDKAAQKEASTVLQSAR